jgi:hypothetical protein
LINLKDTGMIYRSIIDGGHIGFLWLNGDKNSGEKREVGQFKT